MQKLLVIIPLLVIVLGMLSEGLFAASQGDPVAQLSIAEVNEDPVEVGRYVIYADAPANLSADVVSQIQKGAFVIVASKLFGPIAEGTITDVVASGKEGHGLRVEIVCRDVTKPPVLSNFVLVYGRKAVTERVDDPNATFREMWEAGDIDGLRLLVDSLQSDSSFSGYAALKRDLEMVVGFYARFDDAVKLGKLEGYQALMVEFEGQKNKVPPPLYQKLADLLAGYENSYSYIEELMDDEDFGGALQAAEALQTSIQSDQLNVLIRIIRERLNDASPLQDRVDALKQAREQKDWSTVERLINELSTADIRNPLLINYIVECDKLLADYKKLHREFFGSNISVDTQQYLADMKATPSNFSTLEEFYQKFRGAGQMDLAEKLFERWLEMRLDSARELASSEKFSEAFSALDETAIIASKKGFPSPEEPIQELREKIQKEVGASLELQLLKAVARKEIEETKSLLNQIGKDAVRPYVSGSLVKKAEALIDFETQFSVLTRELEKARKNRDMALELNVQQKLLPLLKTHGTKEDAQLCENEIKRISTRLARLQEIEAARKRKADELRSKREKLQNTLSTAETKIAGSSGISRKSADQWFDWLAAQESRNADILDDNLNQSFSRLRTLIEGKIVTASDNKVVF